MRGHRVRHGMHDDVAGPQRLLLRQVDGNIGGTVRPAAVAQLHPPSAEVEHELAIEEERRRRHLDACQLGELGAPLLDVLLEPGADVRGERRLAVIASRRKEPLGAAPAPCASPSRPADDPRRPCLAQLDVISGLALPDDGQLGERVAIDAIAVGVVAVPVGVDRGTNQALGRGEWPDGDPGRRDVCHMRCRRVLHMALAHEIPTPPDASRTRAVRVPVGRGDDGGPALLLSVARRVASLDAGRQDAPSNDIADEGQPRRVAP